MHCISCYMLQLVSSLWILSFDMTSIEEMIGEQVVIISYTRIMVKIDYYKMKILAFVWACQLSTEQRGWHYWAFYVILTQAVPSSGVKNPRLVGGHHWSHFSSEQPEEISLVFWLFSNNITIKRELEIFCLAHIGMAMGQDLTKPEPDNINISPSLVKPRMIKIRIWSRGLYSSPINFFNI